MGLLFRKGQGHEGFMTIPCKMVNTDKKLAPPKQGSIKVGRK